MKILPFLFFVILLSCEKKENLKPNEAPSNFEVVARYTDDEKVNLTWNPSIDPEGKNITYSIVIGKDTLRACLNFKKGIGAFNFE